MAAAEITSATLQCFFWPFTLAEKCKNIGLLQDDDSTNATQRLFCFTQIMVKLFLSTQVDYFSYPAKRWHPHSASIAGKSALRLITSQVFWLK